jgi:hypothetical protein
MKFDHRRSSVRTRFVYAATPRDILPREIVRHAYDDAIRDIEAERGTHQFANKFHRQIADAVFEGCYSALEHFTAWLDERGPPEKATRAELRDELRSHRTSNAVSPRLHVVSAPMGTGKTTFTAAFIVAMVRLSATHPNMPYGCLFLTDQIIKADAIYQELSQFLPKQVAIWTTDHDPACKEPTRVPEPAAKFSKEELQEYPVAIATHALFQRTDGAHPARSVVRHGLLSFRSLTVVDEQMQDVIVHDISLVEAAAVLRWTQQQQHTEITPHLDRLVKFMAPKATLGARIEKPKDDETSWTVAEELDWFATEEAAWYARDNRQNIPVIDDVFGFAKAMVQDYAFIASGGRGPHFVGYEPKHAIVPGMVLLDATADIDGITSLCRWRKHVDVPRPRYDNLDLVHVTSRTDEPLGRHFDSTKNRIAYVKWMKGVIREQMEPGQCGLVVCKKKLIDHYNVPDWPHDAEGFKNPSTYMTDYGWDVEGRHLSITYWGGPGVGSNAWRDAQVVFLFGEHFLPRRTVIGGTQGLLLAPTTSGPIASMNAANANSEEVTTIDEGHLLRWTKQLAMRGRARLFDEHGVCGPQKLVLTGDYERLLLHKDALFPGAKLSTVRDPKHDLSQYTHRRGLLELLTEPGLPEQLSTKQVAERLGVVWADISGKVINDETRVMLKALGWSYVSRKGPSGSVFRRLEPTPGPDCKPPSSAVAQDDLPATGKASDDVEELRRKGMKHRWDF